ncbi:glycosyl transferase family 1 [Roseivivax halodurans JCM 10272]|uniref:Glycosyl transferase family 1 n=2 Tax=Roseivivax halodurans TaxID=93683 RepID=X7EKR0_9RHOB|nr:glycosyltransferase family 4 protein [Roseivivax halodurans]ETX16492.1 glycosyl transferase family 1 [Roseivivax halodurans JCM 10272]
MPLSPPLPAPPHDLDSPSHVLIVGDFADINGGQAKVALDSARMLADAGVQVTFFAACGPVSRRLEHKRISVICLDQPTILDDPNRLRAMRRGIWNGEAAKRLTAVIDGLDPTDTVIHCHGYAKGLSPAIGPVLANAPMPVLFTMHEYFLACPNGGFYDYRKQEICTRRPLGASCLATNCDARHMLHKGWRVTRQVATWGPGQLPGGLTDVAYISELQREVMTPHLGRKVRLHHVPNPVDAPELPPVDPRQNDIFLFVGRLSQEKGAAQFAEAARRAGVRAMFLGDGEQSETVRRLNPEAEILGWQPPEAVQEALGRARALVFPSLWYEGQPLVPIEALMRGVPVICGTWSAARECVEHGENGLVYRQPTVDALADALTRIDDVPTFDPLPLRQRLGPDAHRRRLLDLYGEMLARRRAA